MTFVRQQVEMLQEKSAMIDKQSALIEVKVENHDYD